MKFPEPLVEGRLIRRYKRFLADVRLPDGSEITAHCPNTGSMLGCQPEDARVWLSHSDNPKRKLQYTWELVETSPGQLACVNTARPNSQVRMMSWACGRMSMGKTTSKRLLVPASRPRQSPAICGVRELVAHVSMTSGSPVKPPGWSRWDSS